MGIDILVVDDEAAIANLVEVYLTNEGYTVHKFDNGADALACVAGRGGYNGRKEQGKEDA